MKKQLEILNRIDQVRTDFSLHKVELGMTIKEVVDNYNFFEKKINDFKEDYSVLTKAIISYNDNIEKNLSDLKRIQKSLIDLGFNDEANNLNKYISSNIYKEFKDLYSKVK